MKTLALTLNAFLLGTCNSLLAQANDPNCIGFESITAADYNVGQSIAEDGILMTFVPYIDGNGNTVNTGFGRIEDPAGPPVNQRLRFNNINLSIPLVCAHSAQTDFTFAGGNINIGVNGVFTPPGFSPNGQTFPLGGVTVAISGSNSGTITFTEGASQIQTIVLGGQEFWIDNFCHVSCDNPDPDCFDFENLDDTEYGPGDIITEDGQQITVGPYQAPGGGTINDGVVTRETSGAAGHLGQGAALKNATLNFIYPCAGIVKFHYNSSGESINLSINGKDAIDASFPALNGQTLGGATITVTQTGSNTGIVCLEGFIQTLAIGGERIALDHICAIECAQECIDFEEQIPGTNDYLASEGFNEDGILIKAVKYTKPDGEVNPDGVIKFNTDQNAGHFGVEALLFEIGAQFCFGCAEAVTFCYGEYGGEITLTINGESLSAPDLADLDGQSIGGVMISVTTQVAIEQPSGPIGVEGKVILTGKLEEVTIAGESLWLDHICHTPCPDPDCIDFELEPLGKTYVNGDNFSEDGITLTVRPFQFSSGTNFTGGNVNIGGDNNARHIRHEACIQNATLNWRYNCAQQITFQYADEGGNVNLIIDGQLANVANLSDLDGTTLGGALISVNSITGGGAERGRVTISGIVQTIGVGGQEFWMDHACHVPCPDEDCIDYEELPLGTVYQASIPDGFVEDGVTMKLQPYNTGVSTINNGTITVTNSQNAGHLGQDITFNNANLNFDFGCVQGLNFYYGEYGGTVNFKLNGQPQVVVANLADLDGMIFGGSTVTVNTIPTPGGVIGRVMISGVVTEFMIGGQEFVLDHVCYDPCDPVVVSPVVMTTTNIMPSGDIEITYEVTITGPGVLTVQNSEDVGVSDAWATDPGATVTPMGGGLYEVETTVPNPTPSGMYHRFRVVVGNP